MTVQKQEEITHEAVMERVLAYSVSGNKVIDDNTGVLPPLLIRFYFLFLELVTISPEDQVRVFVKGRNIRKQFNFPVLKSSPEHTFP